MQSRAEISVAKRQEALKQFAERKWESLTDRQKAYTKKAWKAITYKWRWQVAINVPYLAIFLLDRKIPAVHKFDMALLVTILAKFPLPDFIPSGIGLN